MVALQLIHLLFLEIYHQGFEHHSYRNPPRYIIKFFHRNLNITGNYYSTIVPFYKFGQENMQNMTLSYNVEQSKYGRKAQNNKMIGGNENN